MATTERLTALLLGEIGGYEEGGPSEADVNEALRLFEGLRQTPEERRAIDLMLQLHARGRLPEPVLVAAAGALIDRGEGRRAAHALRGATSSAALLMRGDLLAQSGDMTEAVAMAERVLARDIDWPGARERHERWSRQRLPDGTSPALPELGPGLDERVAHGLSGVALDQLSGLAGFRLLREVARGSTGTVYEAQDRALGRRVALKVYHRAERDRALLLHEARVAVALGGEGVVRVFDADAERGWLAMQWAPLGALGAWMNVGNATETLAGWARSLARGLARTHERGWVHHDVKPGNVLMFRADQGLLTDFGNARRAGEPSPPGTRGYVSPERLAGRPSHPRDDVYGFGRVILDTLGASDGAAVTRWRKLATACTGPDATRPADGRELEAWFE